MSANASAKDLRISDAVVLSEGDEDFGDDDAKDEASISEWWEIKLTQHLSMPDILRHRVASIIDKSTSTMEPGSPEVGPAHLRRVV
jgi:hypothetical protein